MGTAHPFRFDTLVFHHPVIEPWDENFREFSFEQGKLILRQPKVFLAT